MRFIVLCLVVTTLSHISSVNGEVTDSDRKYVEKLVEAAQEASLKHGRYAVFGTFEVANLKPKEPGEPARTVSDYIICVDEELDYQRHSLLCETIIDGELRAFDWFTRERRGKELRSGVDKSGLKPREDLIDSPLPAFDPWNLPVCGRSDLVKGRCKGGLLTSYCDIDELVEVTRDARGTLAVFQVNSMCRVMVYFSEKYGGMPSRSSWRVSERSLGKQIDGEDTYPLIDTESSTAWKKIGKDWFPVETYIEQISGKIVKGKKPLAESFAIKMNYAIGDDVKGPLIADFPSVELSEYLIQKAR